MQEIFAERKTSRALEIVMEAGFEPKKSPSGVISYRNTVFLFFHLRNLISEYDVLYPEWHTQQAQGPSNKRSTDVSDTALP